jgi:hypothetical protein
VQSPRAPLGIEIEIAIGIETRLRRTVFQSFWVSEQLRAAIRRNWISRSEIHRSPLQRATDRGRKDADTDRDLP